MHYKITTVSLALMLFLFSSVHTLYGQDIIIQQNATGQHQANARGQAFIPSEFGDGVGNTFGQSTVYLNEFNVYYAGGVEAETLYIYEILPNSVGELDAGTGGILIGESYSKELTGSKTSYKFGNLALATNTIYYAVFRQDVDLLYGESADIAGPYLGGKMLYNNGTIVAENDYKALQFSASLSLTENVNQDDLEALVALYYSADGNNWTNKWDLNGDPKNWYGVAWNAGNRVSSINLFNNGLNGTIPHEIGSLSEMWYLNLSSNKLRDTIPGEIGNLIGLTSLNLSINELNGPIPIDIGNMTSLTSLDMSTNRLASSIPEEIGDLINLSTLDLGSCQLIDSIPASLGKLTNLITLDLRRNSLTGAVPEAINNLTALRTLKLDNNLLTLLPKLNLPALIEAQFYLNYFQFDSFESNIELINNPDLTLRFVTQRSIIFDNQIFEPGIDFTLTVSVKGENNRYQWFRNDVVVSDISTTPDYKITAPDSDDAGYYYCKVTNTVITDLELQTERVVVTSAVNFVSGSPSVYRINGTSVEFDLEFDVATTNSNLYFVALPSGNSTPTEQQIMSGLDADSIPVNTAGRELLYPEQKHVIKVDGLEFSTAYDFHFVLHDGFQVTTDYAMISATTKEPIQFEEGYPKLSYIGANRVIVDVKTTLEGLFHYRHEGSYSSSELSSELLQTEIIWFSPMTSYVLEVYATDPDNHSTDTVKLEFTTEDYMKFKGDPEVSHIGGGTVAVTTEVNRKGSLYYLVFKGYEWTPPTSESYKSGTDGDGNSAMAADSLEIEANTYTEFQIAGFDWVSTYTIFILAEDEDGFTDQRQISISSLSNITGTDKGTFTADEFKLYPNPAEEQMYVEFTSTEPAVLRIINLQGQEIFQKPVHSAEEIIDVKHLPKGIYLVNMETQRKSKWVKFEKK